MREAHPVAALFPILDDERLAALAEDIKEHGQLHPIVLDREGRILDGRNRAYACWKAGVDPIEVVWEGEDTAGYALAANGQRRDLNQGQKAMIGVEAEAISGSPRTTKGELASRLGVSPAQVQKARIVRHDARYLVPQVIAGGSLEQAYTKAIELRDAEKTAKELEEKRRKEWEKLQQRLVLKREEIGDPAPPPPPTALGGEGRRKEPPTPPGPPIDTEALKRQEHVLAVLVNTSDALKDLAGQEAVLGAMDKWLQLQAVRSAVTHIIASATAVAAIYNDAYGEEHSLRMVK